MTCYSHSRCLDSIAIFGRCAIPVMNYGFVKLLAGCILFLCPQWFSKYFRINLMVTITIVAYGLFEMVQARGQVMNTLREI